MNFKNLLLLFSATIISFFAAEVSLRIIFNFPQPQFLVLDKIVGHKHRPNIEGFYTREGLSYVSINSDGFNDTSYTIKRNKKKRIAILGDSYSEAFQVERDKSFHQLLENKFNDEIEVLNFGVSGYGTCQELLMYREYVRKYKPDIVVLAFYPGNDFIDNDRELSEGYPRPYCDIKNKKIIVDNSFTNSPKHLRNRNIYSVYYFLTDNFLTFSLLDQLRYKNIFTKNSNSAEAPNITVSENSDLIYNPVSDKHQNVWSRTEKLISKLASEIDHDKSKFVLFVQDSIPSQLTKSTAQFYVETRFKKMCDKNSFVCGFMGYEAIKNYNETKIEIHGFSGQNSGHWNNEGHSMAYNILRETLIRNNLLNSEKRADQ